MTFISTKVFALISAHLFLSLYSFNTSQIFTKRSTYMTYAKSYVGVFNMLVKKKEINITIQGSIWLVP